MMNLGLLERGSAACSFASNDYFGDMENYNRMAMRKIADEEGISLTLLEINSKDDLMGLLTLSNM